MLGGSAEDLGSYRSQFIGLYHGLIGLMLDMGRAEEAFRFLEASRARALLALPAERDLGAGDLPPELLGRRTQAGADYRQAMAELPPPSRGEPAGLLEANHSRILRCRRFLVRPPGYAGTPRFLSADTATATPRSRQSTAPPRRR